MRNAKRRERNAWPAGVNLKTRKCLKRNEHEKAVVRSGAKKSFRLGSGRLGVDSSSAAHSKTDLQEVTSLASSKAEIVKALCRANCGA